MPEQDILRTYNFLFEISGVRVGWFSAISDLTVEVDVIEVRDGSDPAYVRTLPGIVRYPRLTLSWGVVAARDEMWNWLMSAVSGNAEKKDATVIAVGPDGQQPLLRYEMTGVWPYKWTGADMSALSSEIAIEHMTLVAETLERVSNAQQQPAETATA